MDCMLKKRHSYIIEALDPEGCARRHSHRLGRRVYFSKGPNFIWHLDSYDKLKPFGFCINGCIHGFSRKIIWLNVWKTSSDPKVVAGYYVDAVSHEHGCPYLVRGDAGTENSVVKNLQLHI
jgi:hypothetical protein